MELKFEIPDQKKKKDPTEGLKLLQLAQEKEELEKQFIALKNLVNNEILVLEKFHEELRITNCNRVIIKQVAKEKWQAIIRSVVSNLKQEN